MPRSWRSQIADEVRATSRMKPKWTINQQGEIEMEISKKLLTKFFKWQEGNHCGQSSKAIGYHMICGWSNKATPRDVSDLGRCMRLLEKFPEWKERMPEMAQYGKTWKALSKNWKALEDTYNSEKNTTKDMHHKRPKTWELLKSILDSVESKDA